MKTKSVRPLTFVFEATTFGTFVSGVMVYASETPFTWLIIFIGMVFLTILSRKG